jgi:hypothetical protein
MERPSPFQISLDATHTGRHPRTGRRVPLVALDGVPDNTPERRAPMSDLPLHACGGTLLAGPDHSYCDRCAAFAYDGAPVPSGTDRAANRAAWDAGDEASPEDGLVSGDGEF